MDCKDRILSNNYYDIITDYDHPPPCEAQGRPLDLSDAADDQAVRVKAALHALHLHQSVQLIKAYQKRRCR